MGSQGGLPWGSQGALWTDWPWARGRWALVHGPMVPGPWADGPFGPIGPLDLGPMGPGPWAQGPATNITSLRAGSQKYTWSKTIKFQPKTMKWGARAKRASPFDCFIICSLDNLIYFWIVLGDFNLLRDFLGTHYFACT